MQLSKKLSKKPNDTKTFEDILDELMQEAPDIAKEIPTMPNVGYFQ